MPFLNTYNGFVLVIGDKAALAPLDPQAWVITDNEDGTFTIAAAPEAESAPIVTNNADGTFDVAA